MINIFRKTKQEAEEFSFVNFIHTLEPKILKFINQTPVSLAYYVEIYSVSSVLNASRNIDTKEMTYQARYLGHEVSYSHASKILTVMFDSDPWEYDSRISIKKYKLDSSNVFQPLEDF